MKMFKKLAVLTVSFAFVGAFAQEEGEVLGEYGAITVKMLNGKRTALISSESTETVEITEDVEIDSVYYDRDYSGDYNKPGTLMFPFSMKKGCLSSSAQIAKLTSIVGGETYQIYAQYSNGVFDANTPYFVRPSKKRLEFNMNDPGCFPTKMNTTIGGNKKLNFENWEFTGMYSFKQWNEGDPELGYVYGFAARDTENSSGKAIQQGQFIKGAAGIKIRPFRAYLIYNKNRALAKTGANANLAVLEADDLPATIDVIFLDENGETTAIHSLNTYTGEFSTATGWYDMKGRKLDKKPTIKGMYFNNGKKVVIK